jgi:hypothetical protein
VQVKNQGTAATMANAGVAVYTASEPTACGNSSWDVQGTVGTLSPGATRTVQLTYDHGYSLPGAVNAWAFADHDCAFNELDETNNKSAPLSVLVTDRVPDMAITQVVATPKSIYEGLGVTLEVGVANLGDAAAAATSRVGVFVDQSFSVCSTEPNGGWTAVGALAVGASVTLTIPVAGSLFASSAVEHDIFLLEDYTCSSNPQENYSNDFYGPVKIGVLHPDISIESMKAVPTSPAARAPLSYEVVVRNRGQAPITTPLTLSVYSSWVPDSCGYGVADATAIVPPLAIGAPISTIASAPASWPLAGHARHASARHAINARFTGHPPD